MTRYVIHCDTPLAGDPTYQRTVPASEVPGVLASLADTIGDLTTDSAPVIIEIRKITT